MKFERRKICAQGGRGGLPFNLCVSSAMGDAAIIDVSALTTSQLLILLRATVEEASRRLRTSELDEASDSFSLIDPSPPSQSSSPQVDTETGLLQPFRCPFACRWCQERCTRQPGHKRHSCFEHRHRRR